MRIQVASDLHLEIVQRVEPGWRVVEVDPLADVLVLAGDIGSGTRGLLQFTDLDIPVLYVPGNHEHYGLDIEESLAAMEEAARGTNVTVLNRRSVRLGDVTFLGATLWTDYELGSPADVEGIMDLCDQELADASAIRKAGEAFTARDARQQHKADLAWLEGELRSHQGKKVVVTHHCVHPSLVHSRFHGSSINGGFVSDLSALLPLADVFIGGHVHNSFDHLVGGKRLVVNPRGYPRRRWTPDNRMAAEWENPEFDPCKVIEV